MFRVREENISINREILQDWKAIVREDTGVCIGIVGKNYKVVQNDDLMKHFEKITKKLKIRYEIEKVHEIRNGAKTIIKLKFDIKKKIDKENLNLTGYITNGFNGFSSAKLTLGFFRQVCSNGMIIGNKDIEIGYRHVGSVNEKLVDQFNKYMNIRIAQGKEFVENLINLKFKNLREVYSIIDNSEWFPARQIENVKTAFDEEKKAEKLSYWRLYNAYTKVITHNLLGNEESKIAYMKKLNNNITAWNERR
jgi:hypothetical protein